jgi:hypothetical protein
LYAADQVTVLTFIIAFIPASSFTKKVCSRFLSRAFKKFSHWGMQRIAVQGGFLMSRKVLFAVLVLILLASTCGGGSDLTYKVSGTASRAKVVYKNAEGEMETDSTIADLLQVLQVSDNPDLRQQTEEELQALGAEP